MTTLSQPIVHGHLEPNPFAHRDRVEQREQMPVVPEAHGEPAPDEPTFHVMGDPVRVGGLFYARCSCFRYITEGETSPERARSTVCAFERAEAEAASKRTAFYRAQRIAG